MTFIESLTAIGFGATTFAFIVGVFSVWNGRMTRKEIIKVITKMDEKAELRHMEVLDWFKKSDERAEQRHKEIMEIAQQRHREVIEILKRGFSDLSSDIRAVKSG